MSATHCFLVSREEPQVPDFDEPSFQHLRKLMKKIHNTSDGDLAEIRAELVMCQNRPDKHAFFLQLRNGKMHRSVRQLELDWWQRQVARQEGTATAAPAPAAARVAGSTAGLAGSAPAAAAAVTAAHATSAASAPTAATSVDVSQAAAASKVERRLTSKSGLPGLPQIPLLPQVQSQHFLLSQLQSQPQSQPQPQSQSLHQLKNNVRQDERKLQQQQQQQQQSESAQPLTHFQNGVEQTPVQAVNSNIRQAQTGARPSRPAHRASLTGAEPAHTAYGMKAELSGNCNSDDASGASPKLDAQGNLEAASGLRDATDKAADDNKQNGVAGVESLAQDVLQQIKVHHDGLQTILKQQMQQKSAALGLQQLEAERLSLEGQMKTQQDSVGRYSKILELLRQSMQVDDRDQRYLAETAERAETAQADLAVINKQHVSVQTQLAHATTRFQAFKCVLLQHLCVLNLEQL